jgi:hypothetical protein
MRVLTYDDLHECGNSYTCRRNSMSSVHDIVHILSASRNVPSPNRLPGAVTCRR